MTPWKLNTTRSVVLDPSIQTQTQRDADRWLLRFWNRAVRANLERRHLRIDAEPLPIFLKRQAD